jgi:hypothetical protein
MGSVAKAISFIRQCGLRVAGAKKESPDNIQTKLACQHMRSYSVNPENMKHQG